MKVFETGSLASVTGAVFGSGVSSPPIAIGSILNRISDAYAWIRITGDFGRTGGSVTVFWKGAYEKDGTYTKVEDEWLVKSGTSVSGDIGNGSYLVKFQPGMPFVKLEAVCSKSGSTQHGSGTTNTSGVSWAISIS